MDYSTEDYLMFEVYQYSQFHSFNQLSQLIFHKHLKKLVESDINNKTINQVMHDLSEKLIAIVWPQMENQNHNQNDYQLLQVLVLSRKLFEDIKRSFDKLKDNQYNCDNNYYNYIEWSFKQLNLLIASFAYFAKKNKKFLDIKINNSMIGFKDIFYKLKSLKVLSFLAIKPTLPLELLTVIINETFLWTEPTQSNISIMRLHSRLIAQFSDYVKDKKSFHTHIKEDFKFDLIEVLEFLYRNMPSIIEYLTQNIKQTLIDSWIDNSDQFSDISQLSDPFLSDFISKIVEKSLILKNETELISYVEYYLDQTSDRSATIICNESISIE